MQADVDVLIVGAGPTGLMMACQLLRFGISMRIIDQQMDRVHESRAIGVQAKSMEIFQNLGLDQEFLAKAQVGADVNFYFDGKLRGQLTFKKLNIEGTPFPAIYFIPQSDTEEILIKYLAKNYIIVERPKKLVNFLQDNNGVRSEIHSDDDRIEFINSSYIIGCDGAHSRVRQLLDIPFEGASYHQEFVLMDAKVEWDIKRGFNGFFDKHGVLLEIPIYTGISRMMGAKTTEEPNLEPVTVAEMEKMATDISHRPVTLKDPVWASRFHLHHRAVRQYQEGRAFLAGDAAHIHTPVGAQGMNTGLQDVTNLAWKIACVLKFFSPSNLLQTYQSERLPVGNKLVKTTDRIFGFMTSKSFFTRTLRRFIFPLMIQSVSNILSLQKRMFGFISQLRIKYKSSEFVVENHANSDKLFRQGPCAGHRAPDAPANNSTLFELMRPTPFNILLFNFSNEEVIRLEGYFKNLVAVHIFRKVNNETLFKRYGVNDSGIYVIRPDGYIGFRSYGDDIVSLSAYITNLFR